MKIKFGKDKSEHGPGVSITLTGDEVATAIAAYLVAHGVHISGPRTVTVNGKLCDVGRVYVDPAGSVVTPKGVRMHGTGVKE